MNRYLKLFVTIQIILDIFFNLLNNEPARKRRNDLVVMVGNWRERKESGVDMKEGVIKVSVLKVVLFLWRGLKPPVDQQVQSEKLVGEIIESDNKNVQFNGLSSVS